MHCAKCNKNITLKADGKSEVYWIRLTDPIGYKMLERPLCEICTDEVMRFIH